MEDIQDKNRYQSAGGLSRTIDPDWWAALMNKMKYHLIPCPRESGAFSKKKAKQARFPASLRCRISCATAAHSCLCATERSAFQRVLQTLKVILWVVQSHIRNSKYKLVILSLCSSLVSVYSLFQNSKLLCVLIMYCGAQQCRLVYDTTLVFHITLEH